MIKSAQIFILQPSVVGGLWGGLFKDNISTMLTTMVHSVLVFQGQVFIWFSASVLFLVFSGLKMLMLDSIKIL